MGLLKPQEVFLVIACVCVCVATRFVGIPQLKLDLIVVTLDL